MTVPQTVPTPDLAELVHLLSLADIEMSLVGQSAGDMGHWLRRLPSVKFARDSLPYNRGKTVVADVLKLSQHLALVAELLQKVETEQESAAANPHAS